MTLHTPLSWLVRAVLSQLGVNPALLRLARLGPVTYNSLERDTLPLNFDTRNFTNARREELAWAIHEAEEWTLPTLKAWNYSLCRVHARGWVEEFRENDELHERTVFDRPKPGCRKCGIHFRRHQRISVAWLYFKKCALLADTMGSGKTTSAAGLIAMLVETGEISLFRDRSDAFGGMGRVILVPRSPALHQWRAELNRMIPGLNIIVAEGIKSQRTQLYLQPWHVLLIGPEMLRNDYQMLERFDLSLFLTDDIDQLRNPKTDTSYVLDRIGGRGTEGLRPGTDRYVIMTGTPLQKRLPELHGILDGIGGLERLGRLDSFVKRHVRYNTISEYNKQTGKEEKRQVVVGYKNLGIVKRQIAPLVLRRTAADLDDVDLPTIIPEDVMLDLYPAQRRKYNELRRGVIQIMRETGPQTKHLTALSQIHYGASICAGLAALGEPDGPGTSVKLDWIIDKVSADGDLGDEKVVVFANLKNSVRALQYRLRDAGVGFVTVWGEETDKRKRAASQERFWDDPKCRVLLGTRAIEQSLNLQVSRHLINMDMILNPARMEQLAGRIRRDGSAYQHVYVHNLLTVNTQEERYLPLLEREAALASHIWDENSQLFQALSPLAMLQLISG